MQKDRTKGPGEKVGWKFKSEKALWPNKNPNGDKLDWKANSEETRASGRKKSLKNSKVKNSKVWVTQNIKKTLALLQKKYKEN